MKTSIVKSAIMSEENVKVILGIRGKSTMTNREVEMMIKHIYAMVTDIHAKLIELEELIVCTRRDREPYLHEVNDDPDCDLDCELDYWM